MQLLFSPGAAKALTRLPKADGQALLAKRRKPGSVAAYRRLATVLALSVDDLLPDAGD